MPTQSRSAKKRKRKKKSRAELPSHLKKRKIHVYGLGAWAPGWQLTPDDVVGQIYQQADERLEDLIKHYKIPPHSPEKLWLLSFYLARDLGLMEVAFGPPPNGPGRPSKWKNTGMGEIAGKRISEKVDRRQSRKNFDVAILSKTAAAENLIIKHPEYKNLTSKSLVNRAGEAKPLPGAPLFAPLKQHWLAARRQRQTPPEK
jgi:hypothetical protein